MNIEKLIEVMNKLNFSFGGDRDSLLFTRGDLEIRFSIDKPQFPHNRYFQFLVTRRNDVVYFDIIPYEIDIIKTFSKKVIELFRDEIRIQKIDLILEN